MCCFLLTLPWVRMFDEQGFWWWSSHVVFFLARGASQGYAPQSCEITGILKQLMAAQKEEVDCKANHAEIVAAKEEIALTATIETRSLKNDLADTQRFLPADLELAAMLAKSRSSQSSEWEERQVSSLGEGALRGSRTSRKTHVLFTSVNLGMWLVVCIRDDFGQVVMWFTWCSVHVVAHVVVLCSFCPMACHKSGADRGGADCGRFCAADFNNIVMWVILPNNADWDYFKTLTLREILKIQNPLLEEHCAFLEVIHLFQQVRCARNKLLFLTVQQNLKSSLWTLEWDWMGCLFWNYGI